MSKSMFYLLGLTTSMAFLLPFRGRAERPSGAPTPVLVELFTSEGCSSCPPADRLLRAIEAQKTPGAEIIVMSEHVDYWDYLGWRDPFSSAQFSKRQQDYGRVFARDGVYTPQMVVNGRAEFVGNDGKLAFREITKAVGRPAASVRIGTIEISSTERTQPVATVQLIVEDLPQSTLKGDLELMVAVTETGLHSKPRTGENSGTALEHTGVVRTLIKAGRAMEPTMEVRIPLDPSWNRHALRIVAFVQAKKSRIVWGAAQAPLEPAAP